AGEELPCPRPKNLYNLRERPDVELAFLAFRIRVERGEKSALSAGHLALEPADGLSRAFAKQVLAATLEGKPEQFQQLRVVVEHFFEMRHQPALVDRVT